MYIYWHLLKSVFYPISIQTIREIWREKFEQSSLFIKMSEKDRKLFENLESVQESCGEICDTTITGTPGKVWKTIFLFNFLKLSTGYVLKCN